MGGVVTFGLVFLHPFIDDNGRLSQLLAHYNPDFQLYFLT
jgi:hypothetical protein